MGLLIGGFLAAKNTSASPMNGRYPYAIPNISVASIQAIIAAAVAVYVRSSCGLHPGPDDVSPKQNSTSPRPSSRRESRDAEETTALLAREGDPLEPAAVSTSEFNFRQMWTMNVTMTMVAQFFITGHLNTFSTLWTMLLSMPVSAAEDAHLPISFSGGVGRELRSVGIAMSLIGFVGIVIQVILYPSLQDRYGTLRLWRMSLWILPIAYILAPFCSYISALSFPSQNNIEWKGEKLTHAPAVLIFLLLITILFVTGRTGVVPATTFLINDCTPHPSVRGTVHATAVLVSNLGKSFPDGCISRVWVGPKVAYDRVGILVRGCAGGVELTR